MYHEGLVDCVDGSQFDEKLAGLKSKWDGLEKESASNTFSGRAGFHDWFYRIKAPEMRESTLRFVRESAGLGSPPTAFYTNHSESINALLKESLHYKKHQWGVFNEKVEAVVMQQQKEIEKSIIGYGEYRLRSEYSFLAVSEEKWFCMTQLQRQKHVGKFNSCKVCLGATAEQESLISSDITIGQCTTAPANKLLSVKLQDGLANTRVPFATGKGIWEKAEALLSEKENALVHAPGFGPKDMMVKSRSGSTPHLVTITASGTTGI